MSNQNDDDFSYLPRPGQSRGKTYLDLMGKNIEGMRRAVHEDGINFAGMTYPKKFHQFKIQPVLDGLFSYLKWDKIFCLINNRTGLIFGPFWYLNKFPIIFLLISPFLIS